MPVLIILAVLWAVVLLPPLLRSRSQRTADSIVDFNFKLGVLGRTNGNVDDPGPALPRAIPVVYAGPAVRSTAAQRSAKRRRDVFRALTLSIVITLLLASAAHSSVAWGLQIFVDVVAVTYLGLWAWLRSVQVERLTKVRYMPELRVPELRVREVALRRSASS